jgi:hypothetical protein
MNGGWIDRPAEQEGAAPPIQISVLVRKGEKRKERCEMLNWTGWDNPYAIAYMLVMLGTIIFVWLIPDEYLYE